MSKILIVNSGPLWSNPRSVKEADALAGAGHEVTVAGLWLDKASVTRDRSMIAGRSWSFSPALDVGSNSLLGTIRGTSVRVRSKFSRELYAYTGLHTAALHGYGANALLLAALKADADLTIVHSEIGLWIGRRLLEKGKKVGVDFEDWFSEDIPPSRFQAKRVGGLRDLENLHVHQCHYVTAASKAMATAIAAEYDSKEPKVVYNSFPNADSIRLDGVFRDRARREVPSLHWFSQTIGPDRGLELLFRAIPLVPCPFEVHLRGNLTRNNLRWLESLLNHIDKKRVFFHDVVPNSELLSRIAEHDVGLALETGFVRSREVTITNKMFQYMQAGLAIVATDTAGQREVFNQAPDVGLLIRRNDPSELAQTITTLISNNIKLQTAKRASRDAFTSKFYWEQNITKIVELARQALQ